MQELIAGQEMLQTVIGAMLTARAGLHSEFMHLHRRMPAILRGDDVCRQLMTVPGVGALMALSFKTAIDGQGQFTSSKAVGAHFGLTQEVPVGRDRRDRRGQQGRRLRAGGHAVTGT